MNHSTIDNQTGSCENNNNDISAVDNFNVFESEDIKSYDIKHDSTIINSDTVNNFKKVTTVTNDYGDKGNELSNKNYQRSAFTYLQIKDDLPSFKFYQSLLRKILEMDFEDEILSVKQDNEKRFDEVENILFKAIYYVFKKTELEFHGLYIITSIQESLSNILELPLNFSIRKTLFSLIFFMTSHPSIKGKFHCTNERLADIIAYNTYLKYFVPFLEIAIIETISIEENFEFRIMVKMLYDRICYNFNYNILPLQKQFVDQYLSFLKFGLELFSQGIVKIFSSCKEHKEKIEIEFVDTILVIENIIIHILYIVQRRGNKRLTKETFNGPTKRTLFTLGLVIYQIGYLFLTHGIHYLIFIHHVKLWKIIMEFIIDSEDFDDDESLKEEVISNFGCLENFKNCFDDLVKLYIDKKEEESNK
ncbi:Hypothetical protein SRAE_X000195700 [Strongyloides ratti]|uniref:Uncharacterized protein n=1 Tax=Strongyloides ratti TaxID=34506 RepID=A0A090KWK5_STRRB|nr:Hypothetical protein SRAE_X000195700 [Strongyloides ratti]CEF60217.1 Hypothetical protein SRAE_X000195700 [Strongyloides ratti]